jgi:hypothetical protein
MAGLYLPTGYVDAEAVLDMGSPFIFGWGGRGIGKTYGMLSELYRRGLCFAYMRNIQNEIDLACSRDGNVFRPLNEDNGWSVVPERVRGTKYVGAFYNGVEVEGSIEPAGPAIGYGLALSSVARVRGFSLEAVDVVFYDEFIPEAHTRKIQALGDAFYNAYETINRNRELKGRPALKVVCMANANRVDNDLFLEFGLVTKAYDMQRKGIELFTDHERGITLINFAASPISDAKKTTALYRFAGQGSAFSAMALGNDFGYDDSAVKSKSLKPYRKLCNVGEIDIYEHRDGAGYYVRPAKVIGAQYPSTERGLKSAKYRYGWLHGAWLDGSITFENVLSNVLFERYFT